MIAVHELTADERLQLDVLEALYQEPEVPAASIGVEAGDGVVTLTGTVDSVQEGLAAECSALQLPSVRAIVNDIELRPRGAQMPADAEIRHAAIDALKWDMPHCDGITVSAGNGRVLLEGTVDQEYQKRMAELVVLHVKGVQTVLNCIEVEHPMMAPVGPQPAWAVPDMATIESYIGTIP